MTHFGPEYARFMEGGSSSMGSNITLTLQPPKSTYLHVNYLSILQALQACQWDSVDGAISIYNPLAFIFSSPQPAVSSEIRRVLIFVVRRHNVVGYHRCKQGSA